MVDIQQNRVRQPRHNIRLRFIFKPCAEKMQSRIASCMTLLDFKCAFFTRQHINTKIFTTAVAAQSMPYTTREKNDIPRTQQPGLLLPINSDITRTGSDDMHQTIRTLGLMPHIPFPSKQTLNIHAAFYLRQFDQPIQNIHSVFLPINEMF